MRYLGHKEKLMRTPFDLFSSSSLGLTHSSLDQITLLPTRPLNSSKSKIAINVATGNVVIRDTPFSIQDDGVTLTVGMLWNSLDPVWRFGVVARLEVASEYEHVGSLSLVEADGRAVVYVEQDGQYVCSAPDEHGKSTITYDEGINTYTRFFPDSGIQEIFDAEGQLKEKVLPTGKKLTYRYQGNEVNEITLPSGRKINLAENGKLTLNDEQHNLSEELAVFERNGASLVTTVDDNCTDYSFDTSLQDKKQVIIQQKGETTTKLILTNSGVIKEFTDGQRTWTFKKENNTFEVKDSDDNKYEIGITGADISSFKLPAENKSVGYEFTAGQLTTVTDKDNQSRRISYDKVTGLPDIITDSLGRKTTIQYSANGLKQSETHEEKGAPSATKRFRYNQKRQCIFEISAEGRVTKFEYDEDDKNKARLTAIKKAPLLFNAVDLEGLDKWWAALDQTKIQMTRFRYDDYGRCNQIVGASQVTKKLDAQGRVVKSTLGTEATIITPYDHLDQIKQKQVEVNSIKQITTYEYGNNRAIVKRPNGLNEKFIYDPGRLLQATTRADEKLERIESYDREKNGAIKKIVREDQKIEYQFHDQADRLRFSISADGTVSEFEYDARDKISCRKEYVKPIPQLAIAAQTINSLQEFSANNKIGLSKKSYYDSEKQLTHEIHIKKVINEKGEEELEGFVTEHEYLQGNKVKTIRYATAIANFDLEHIVAEIEGDDRETHYFYDKDNLLIGEQDAAGFLKEYERDGIGNISREIIYLNPTEHADTLSDARPKNTDALITSHQYDQVGHKIQTIDSDSIVTTFTYHASGKLDTEKTHGREIKHIYDGLGRECKITNSQTQLEITIAYDTENNEISRTLTDLVTGKTRTTQKRFNKFGEAICEATARISEVFPDDSSKWINHEIDPNTGLRVSTTDTLNNKTIFYYDENRRPVLEIAADGSVIKTEYDPICGKPTLIYHYGTRFAALLNELRGGFVSDEILNKFSVNEEIDRVTQNEYDGEGLLLKQTKPNGSIHRYWYNSFRECVKESHVVDKDKAPLILLHEYDARGNRIKTIKDPDNVKITTSQKYNDALNRITESTDELNNTTCTAYNNKLREQVITNVTKSGETRQKTKKQDAFMRIQSETDWTNTNAVEHTYQDAERAHTITIPITDTENRIIVEKTNAFGDSVARTEGDRTTTYEPEAYDPEKGKFIQKTTYADDSSESDVFDVMGRQESHADVTGKVTSYERNVMGQIKTSTDQITGDNRVTVFEPNVFGENETITLPDAQIQKVAFTKAGLPQAITTDANRLKLVTENVYTASGALKQIKQGDAESPYQENVETDVLGRETKRTIDMGAGAQALDLKSQAFDAAGHLVEMKDGKGNTTRHIFDSRGNLCFIIDPEGFVTEKAYDKNNNEIARGRYVKPISSEELTKLDSKSTPAAIAALLIQLKSNADELRQWRYNFDGKPTHEICFIDGDKATLTTWKYNSHGECIKRIQYANYLSAQNETVDEKGIIANPEKDRTTDFCRNKRGKIVFTRDGEGYITEKRRDAKGRVIAKIQYAVKDPTIDFSQSPDHIRTALNQQPNIKNRECYFVYDLHNNLRFQIDATGFVKEFRYNKANQKTDVIAYFKQLSKESLAALRPDLGRDGLTRDVNALLSNVSAKIIADAKDIQLVTGYDTAGRVISERDGEKQEETYRLNALGLRKGRKDKCNNNWRTEFDRAKRIKSVFSPKIDVATIIDNKKEATIELSANPNRDVSIETRMHYDKNSNVDVITFAADTKSERSIEKTYDKNNHFIGTQINNVTVDDGSTNTEALSENSNRPVKTINVTTKKIVDYAGREVVDIDENGIKHFTVYDRGGNKRFVIDGEGYVTEWIYLYGFKEASQSIRYDKLLSQEIIDKHVEGFTLTEMSALLKKSVDDDRTLTFQYDRRGLKIAAEQDKVITAVADEKTDDVTSEKIIPKTAWEYNAFGEIVRERVTVNSKTDAETIRYYDNNGNEIITVSPKGFVTKNTYEMSAIVTRIELAAAVNQSDRENVDQILKLFEPVEEALREGKDIQGKDRVYLFTYDKRLLQTMQTIKSGDDFYVSRFNKDTGKAEVTKAGKSVTSGTDYDAEGRPIAYFKGSDGSPDSGAKRYLNRNGRGDVIVETGFPLITDVTQPAKIPVTSHLIDAHGQVVGSTQHSTSGSVDEKTHRITVSLDPHDESSLLLTDNCGNVVMTQTPEGHVKFATFDAAKRPVRTYHWVTGYQLSDDKQDEPSVKPIKHFRQNRTLYDKRNHIKMTAAKDDDVETQNWKKFNAYSEVIGEGPNEPDENDMPLQRRYNKAGHCWFTNEEHGIPTISFADARGSDVVAFRAGDNTAVDLSKADLLDRPYSETFQAVQRTVYERDLENNIVVQKTPWARVKPKDAPQNVQVSFYVTSDHKKIEWKKPDIETVVPEFKIRTKGTDEWDTLTVKDAVQKGFSTVDIASYPSDCYEYQLDYYFKDPEQPAPDHFPSFRAEGETLLDTGNYANTNHLLWYMRDDHTLVFAGKTEGIVGIEIRQEGLPPKRLAVDSHSESRTMSVALGDEISGDYEFSLLKKPAVLQNNLIYGQTGPYTIEDHHPVLKFTSSSSVEAKGLPAELKIYGEAHIAAPQIQPPNIRIPYKEHGIDHHLVVNPTEATPDYYLSAQDANQKKHFIGHYVGKRIGNSWDYDGNVANLDKMDLPSFSVLRGPSVPDALSWTNQTGAYGTCSLQPLGNSAYRTAYPIQSLASEISVISLAEAETSPVLGHIAVRTGKNDLNKMMAREISLTDLVVTRCVTGMIDHQHFIDKPNVMHKVGFHYRWKTNISDNHHLIVNANGAECRVDDLSALPDRPMIQSQYGYPTRFQQIFPDGVDTPDPGILSVGLVMEDTNDQITVPLGLGIAPAKPAERYRTLDFTNPSDLKQLEAQGYNSSVAYWEIPHSRTTYPDMHVLHFSPIDESLADPLTFEYLEKTITNKEQWIKYPANLVSRTKNGIAVNVSGMSPGHYSYRFEKPNVDTSDRYPGYDICLMTKEIKEGKVKPKKRTMYIGLDEDPLYYMVYGMDTYRTVTPANMRAIISNCVLTRPVTLEQIKRTERVMAHFLVTISLSERDAGIPVLDNHVYGEMVIKHNQPGCMTFISKSKDEPKKIIKPVAKQNYDRWHNPLSTLKRGMNDATTNEFNALNQKIKTTPPPVDVWEKEGKKAKKQESLITQNLINLNGDAVGTIMPNGAQSTRVVNNSGIALCETDADGVTSIASIDLLKRIIGVVGPSGATIATEYSRSAGLRNEIRNFAGGVSENIQKNEDGHVIRQKNKLGHLTHFDKDRKGRDTLRINPRLKTQRQKFDPQSGVRTYVKDEDGNEQQWETDGYHGNVKSHTDMSGQKINFTLGPNKQVMKEEGDLSTVKNSERNPRGVTFIDEKSPDGQLHDPKGSAAPPARNIEYIHDEAGRVVEIVDNGANLRTLKRLNEDDYCEAYYFVDKNSGRVHQATYTEFDEMQRQKRIYDTKIAFHLGYDRNSNRRFSRVYMYGQESQGPIADSEQWYDYTPANRVMLRDCISKYRIAFSRNPITGEVDSQTVTDRQNKKVKKVLSYYPADHVNCDALADVTTLTNDTVTGHMHRDYLKDGTLERLTQSGCDVIVAEHQPSEQEYFNYVQPTYVMSIGMRDDGQTDWQLRYYKDKEVTVESARCKAREKVEHNLQKIAFENLNPEQINDIKRAIFIYDSENHANGIDEKQYDEANHLQHMSHKENNSKRVVERDFPKRSEATGAPLVEVNVTTVELEKHKKASWRDTITFQQRFTPEGPMTGNVIEEREHLEVSDGYKIDQKNPKGEVYETVDSNGNVKTVQGKLEKDESYRSFVTNSENCIVYKQSAKGRNYYFYAEKRPGKIVFMGYFGDLPDAVKLKARIPSVIKFDNYQPISDQWPPVMPSQFEVPSDGRGMTYDQIADALHRTGYGGQIALANDTIDPTVPVPPGTTVIIPALYYEVADTAWNGSLPQVESIIGSLYPAISAPTIRLKPPKVNWTEKILEVAAAVAIMAFAPELIAGLLTTGVGGLTALGTLTAAATDSMAAAVEVGAVYGVSGAIANAVTQGIAVGMGGEKRFDVNSMLTTAITSAISAGVLGKMGMLASKGNAVKNIVENVATAEGIALAQQAVLLATHLEKRPDWRAFATAAFNTAVGAATSNIHDEIASVVVNSSVNAAGGNLIAGHPLSVNDISVNVLGSMVGAKVGNSLSKSLQDQQLAMQRQITIDGNTPNVGHALSDYASQQRQNNMPPSAQTGGRGYLLDPDRQKKYGYMLFGDTRSRQVHQQSSHSTKELHEPEKGLLASIGNAYLSPDKLSSVTVHGLSEVTAHLGKEYEAAALQHKNYAQRALDMPVKDTMASKSGSDLGSSASKAENAIAKNLQRTGKLLSKFSVFAKDSMYALKAVEIGGAVKEGEWRDAIEKSMELGGEVVGTIGAAAVVSLAAIPSEGAAFATFPVVATPFAETGAHLFKNFTKAAEDVYDDVTRRYIK